MSGVIEQPVCKTTFNFDALVSKKLRQDWGKLNIELIRVNPGFDIQKQNEKSNVYHLQKQNNLSGYMQMRYRYISWKDFYFETSICDKYEKFFRFGNRNYVFVLSGVVFLLFLVGVLNFVNLYSVVMQKRRKIYGVKKVFGLSGRGLFTEMWMENFLLFACAVFLSWCIVEISSGLWEGLFSEKIPVTGFDWYLSLGLLLLVPLFTAIFFYIRYGYKNPVTGGENVIVLNRSAMKLLGYTDLKEAFVRSTSPLSISFVDNKLIEFGVDMTPVSAVVEDYYMGHLTEGIKPMIFIVGAKDADGDVLIKVKKDREKEVIDNLRKVEKEIYNSEDFTYKWADDIVAEMYQKDKETAHIYTVFSYIAIVISCLGLLGISLFDIRRRYREIAIRKVNGAKPKDLYILLGKNYMLNLVLAFVVAAPVSWIVIYYYTASFVEKAPVTFGLFVIPLLIVLILSMLTLYYQINKAAHINPAEVMKSE